MKILSWPKVGPSWPKLGPSWPKLAPSWPKLTQDGNLQSFEGAVAQSGDTFISKAYIPKLPIHRIMRPYVNKIPLGISRGFLYNVLKASDRRPLPRVPPVAARGFPKQI